MAIHWQLHKLLVAIGYVQPCNGSDGPGILPPLQLEHKALLVELSHCESVVARISNKE